MAKQQGKSKNERLVELSWWILEQKIKYYILATADVEDWEYDLRETEYNSLAKELGLNPTASAVGVDVTRPSVQLIMRKLQGISLGY